MNIYVRENIQIYNPSDEITNWVKRELVIANPEYAKKKRLGLWLGKTPQRLCLYETQGDCLILPYGCLRKVIDMMNHDDSISIVMKKHQAVPFGYEIPLYDYQEVAVEEMVDAQYGILQAPAGSGKTQMGLAIASKIGRRTLWLTHTHDLLEQSKERAERYMDTSLIGTITEGKVNIGETITFATVQTMCNLLLLKYRYVWDTIIVDECHRVAGTPTSMTLFYKVLNSLAARHKYGLSATVHRADGMIVATHAILGEVVWTVPESAVADKIMKVSVLPRAARTYGSREYLDTDGTIVYTKLINYLAKNEERNEQIMGDLILNKNHYCLILSDRLEQLRYLMENLPPKLRAQAVMVDGKMTSKKAKEERKKALEDMRAGTKRYLFATYALAKEGLDIQRLDRLFLATPQKDYAVVAQSVGRIARTFEHKEEPVVYDYVDNIGNLVRSFKARCRTYRKLGCNILEG